MAWNSGGWQSGTVIPGPPIIGGLTSNRLLKIDSSSQVADSSLTDDGSTVTSTVPVALPAGTYAAPALTFNADNANALFSFGGVLAFRGGFNVYHTTSSTTKLLQFGSGDVGYVDIASTGAIRFGDASIGSIDTILARAAAANLRLGAAAANPPVAQTLSVQNASGTDIAGANFTLDASQGTGTGAGGSFIIRTAAAGGTGSSLNALAAALTIDSTKQATFADDILLANGNRIGTTGGANWAFAASNPTAWFDATNEQGAGLPNDTRTSGAGSGIRYQQTFAPASGSGSFAALHLNPTINGTSSGTAYGLVVASKTNTLTGGSIKLLSLGTTTTDAFTGYTSVFDVSTTGQPTIGASDSGVALVFNSRGSITPSADGVFTLLDSVGVNFTRANFGGTTNAFPALKRSGAVLQARLADDSAHTNIETAGQITAGSGTGVTVNAAGFLRRHVYSVTVTYAALAAAATTADKTIATLPAKTRLVGVVADTTTPYTGGGVTAATLIVGKTVGGNEYLVSHDVLSAAILVGDADADLGTSINRASAIQGGDLASWTGTTDVSVRLTTVTANTDQLTAGSTTYYLTTESMP